MNAEAGVVRRKEALLFIRGGRRRAKQHTRTKTGEDA